MSSKTKVVNIGQHWDVYIGRNSIFGNPFVIGPDGNRYQVINQYKIYFYNRIEKDPEFKKAVMTLKGKTLGCFCKPLACHGDIIAEFLDNDDLF